MPGEAGEGSGLEEIFELLHGVPGASFPAPVPELEELAEVRPVLLNDALGGALAAFVVGGSIVEPAVEADLYVRAAPGTALAPAGPGAWDGYSIAAPALTLYSPLAMEAFGHRRYFNTGREKNKPFPSSCNTVYFLFFLVSIVILVPVVTLISHLVS